ncbi:GNAT family N-acetyltransferase [Streptomyces sp900105755]|uniref:GNAT family N-acetyltransferase n=1 Tax=Streptomyces sp. 900105755 TaxID=3154389 RepID=UPI0033175285
MDHRAVLALYDRDMREGAKPDGPGARIERVGAVVRHVADAGGWNGVLWSDLDAATADRAIAAQVEFFAARGQEFEWKVYGHDLPPDLGDRLTAAGFRPEPQETLMIGEVARLSLDTGLPDGVRVVPATDRAGIELVVDVHEKAFGTDGSRLRHQMLTRLADQPDSMVALVALAGDEPVSAARVELVTGARFAGLWGGGTVAQWRGRGVYRALVAHRAQVAAAHGCRYLQVDALPTSRTILERLGFHALTTTTPYLSPV